MGAHIATLRHAAALCLIAGFVDAVGYFQLGHVFTANMTGNTVLLGVAAVNADGGAAIVYLLTIAGFILGVVAAALLKMRLPGPHMPLFVNAAVLALLDFASPSRTVSLVVLAAVMGLQGGAINQFSGMRLPTVVVTSTLVSLVESLVQRAVPANVGIAPNDIHIAHWAAAWIAYGVGGAAGVLAERHISQPLIAPALLTGLVAFDLLRRQASIAKSATT